MIEIFQDIQTFVVEEIEGNQFAAGGIITVGVSALLYQAKAFPRKVWSWIKYATTSQITVSSNEGEEFFDKFLISLSDQKRIIRQSKFTSLTVADEEGRSTNPNITLGYGNHYFVIENKPCVVNYSVDEGSNAMSVRRVIELTALTRNPISMFKKLSDKANKISFSNEKDADVFMFKRGYWNKRAGIVKRNLSSVFVDKDLKKDIKQEIEKFLDSKEYCMEKSIPWSLSFLFTGKPGTGKSSLCLAIASEFDIPIYILNLSSINSDETLDSAFSGVKSGSILLIEDVDAFRVSKKRKETSKDKNQNLGGLLDDNDDDNSSLTLSGLLNCMSGIYAKNGIITMMTTNHPEKIDPALLRPGRVDRKIEIPPLSEELAKDMFDYLSDSQYDAGDYQFAGKTGAEIEQYVKTLKAKNV